MRVAVLLVAVLFLGAAGCFSALPVNALGYRCNTDADCENPSLRCEASLCVSGALRGDGGFPTAATTGVPSEVLGSLTPSGPLTLDRDGGVYDLLDIDGCVVITGNGITLKRSRIRCGDYFDVQVEGSGARLEDLEIDGKGNTDANGISGDGWTALRIDAHSSHQPFLMGNHTSVSDSYAHDFYKAVDAQSGVDILVQHNTLAALPDGELDIDFDQTFGALSDVIIDRNYLSGGNFAIAATGKNITITNNVIAGDQLYGPFTLTDGGFTISGNVFLDGGAANP